MNRKLLYVCILAVFTVSCSDNGRDGDDPPIVDCNELLAGLNEYTPVILTTVSANGDVMASFAVMYPDAPELLFWGFTRNPLSMDSISVGLDMDSLSLVTEGYTHISRCSQWNNVIGAFYQPVDLPPSVPQDPYLNLEVQVYHGGNKKGKGTLVSTHPMLPVVGTPDDGDGLDNPNPEN